MKKEKNTTKKMETDSLNLAHYGIFLEDIKTRIRAAQTRAMLSANSEMLLLYWDVGRMIDERQKREGWGAAVIPHLARDIKYELPEVKGFSERNIKLMTQFYREYPWGTPIGQLAVAQTPAFHHNKIISPQLLIKSKVAAKVQRLVAQLPWAHNVLLMQKIKHIPTRCWYMMTTIQEGWSRDVLATMIKSRLHERQGKAVTNFDVRLSAPQSDLVQQVLKDPYIFDFLTLEEPFHEREMEINLIQHLEKFLLELGQGFAFVGRQFHLEVDKEDFYIDLLFYHLKLRCFVVIDLKKGVFRPEYAGKMNFYCSVVDERLRHENDHPTIGLILCQDKKRVVAEYTLRDVKKPIGVSEYDLTRALPTKFKSALPAIEAIEKEFSV